MQGIEKKKWEEYDKGNSDLIFPSKGWSDANVGAVNKFSRYKEEQNSTNTHCSSRFQSFLQSSRNALPTATCVCYHHSLIDLADGSRLLPYVSQEERPGVELLPARVEHDVHEQRGHRGQRVGVKAGNAEHVTGAGEWVNDWPRD